MDFRSLKREKDIISKISDFWRCRKVTTVDCLKESNVLLLVDNISFSQEHILQLKTLPSSPQPPSKNDIALKEKIGNAEKEAQRGENRHKEA